ncbi:MAG: hypothetical protein KAS63_04335 [Candidatus Heimdallarchaeota archaeon]|nr:hypothetical protein [Candidatus Heimdallarchaeota archaeon]MCK4954563.1 hypothetical protein [Candidatus Heimdallarchaeota archaeon]
MKLPICVIDAQTNTLCRKCKQLYREGKINDIDIELSKILIDVSKSNKELKNITIHSSVELEDVVIIVTKNQDVPLLSSPDVIDSIKQHTKKDVRFLERTKDPKKLVESLLYPIPVLNVSTLYLPPFSEKEYKVEIEKKYKGKLPIPEEVIVQTITSVLGTDAFMEYV